MKEESALARFLILALFLVAIRFAMRPRSGMGLFTILAVGVTALMIVYPDVAYQSAVKGLRMWWDIVFPALLPFFVGAEILMGLGVVHFAGVLFEPLMRPLFNVPGTGAFVVAMGLASGYPIGAILTARIRKQNLCSKTEAERLMSFSNTSDPLFMSGAVAAGMFGSARVGTVLMLGHYISALAIGLLMRFYAFGTDMTKQNRSSRIPGEQTITRAYNAMVKARAEDGRPFGALLGDSVKNSVNSLLLIGGFIILFSSVIAMLETVGIISVVQNTMAFALRPLGLDASLAPAAVGGLFEITNGATMASMAPAPLVKRVALASAIIAWSGLSVHGQVAAVIQGTDISVRPYIVARILQAPIAGYATFFISEHLLSLDAVPTIGQSQALSRIPGIDLRFWQNVALGGAHVLKTVGLVCLLGFGLTQMRIMLARRRQSF